MRYALIFDTREEFERAAELVGAKAGQALPSDDDTAPGLVDKLEAALAISPLNPQKATVLKTWLAAPAGEWVPFARLAEAFVVAGLGVGETANNRASAAVRDLSWQVSQILTQSELAAFDKAIEALASRSRAAGVSSYRLTAAGRLAARRFMKKEAV